MRFWSLIKKLAADGKTIFVTTHYMDEAENCDRIALMRAGELIAIDSPQNLKKQTFGDTLYNFTPRVDNPVFPPEKILDICEPYEFPRINTIANGNSNAIISVNGSRRICLHSLEKMAAARSRENVFIGFDPLPI